MATMSTVEVRPVDSTDDLSAVGEVVRRAYFALDGYPREPQYDHEIGAIDERMHVDTVAVAVRDGVAVGCVTYVRPGSPAFEFHDHHAASFRYFGVDPAVQGGGVGAAMVQWCIDRARADGYPRLRIHSLDCMQGAQRLYRRFGFERDTEHDEDWDGIFGYSYVLHL